MDSVARGSLINLTTRVAGVVLVLAITTLAARLSTHAQGAFALFTSAEALLVALMSGFGVALARRVSHQGEQPGALAGAIVLACLTVGALAGLALWAVSAWGAPAYRWLWILALAAPMLLLAPNLQGLWLGEGRMAPMARLALAPPLLALLGLGALAIGMPLTLGAILGAWVLAKVVVGFAVVAVLWRGSRIAAPDFRQLRRELPFVATIGLTNLIGLMNYRVGLFVVESQLGLAATGVYSIAVVVAELLWFVSGSLTQAAYGRIGTPDRAQAATTTMRVVHLGLTLLLLAAPLLWLAARWAVPSVLGAAYVDSLLPLAVLLPGTLLFGGASALSAYFTNHARAPQVAAWLALGSLVANAVLSMLLVPQLGMVGAALAATLSYVANVALAARVFASHAGMPLRDVLLPGAQLAADLRALCRKAWI
jgi:O-antigen/teichoic acid export membrane protein